MKAGMGLKGFDEWTDIGHAREWAMDGDGSHARERVMEGDGAW